MERLENKVVIVTGSSRGIGKEVAILLAKHGAKIVVNHSNSEKEANETVAEIANNGGSAIAVKADVSQKGEVTNLFDQALATFGKVDVLVNNAGTMLFKSLKDSTQEDFTSTFDVNVRGVFNTMQEAESKLSDKGKIINFSSSTASLMMPNYSIYSASKAAVEQMTKVFAKEIGRGICVNAIAPGATETDMFMEGKSQEQIDKISSMNVFNRLSKPIDIARVVLFLASDESSWVTGQVIGANGGMV